ncbi:SipW-dependent-type signal peptide-containing protein [Rhodococcus sp. IEGM 1381]|uniref:SipW-dependent-type signal peptide-containing protein n=1 Tax=Rhodococcus sp. IEGM 1381 TaxID=3047085 RepID=UPI0024B75E10|nr:SipW-dependent-type signal peptide-containing protein [Rhodococcus sp. IEGM 1381]MDI9898121.1 SipW-dependent-type signal peptide-containing protein [Rhodococcus sp. IEGM 1381]
MSRHSDSTGPKAVLRRIGAAMISARARAIMSIGIVLGLGAVGTLAAWSDTATATSGTFTTGKLDIMVGNPAVDNNPTAFSTALTKTAMFPGDTVAAGLLVTNAEGSVANNYTISVLASDATLGLLLDSSVFSGPPVSGACSGSPLSTVSGLNTSKPFPGLSRPLLARPTSTIITGQTDQLCINVTMRSTAASPTTPATGTITYTLTATSS